MTHYFFVAASLPALYLGNVPEMHFAEFDVLVKDNLLLKDYKQIEILRRYYDLLNIRALLKGNEFDPHGNLDETELEVRVIDQENLPAYVLDFLKKYSSKEERLKHFPLLLADFFKKEVSSADPFVKHYLDFERKLRLIMVGFRAKQLGRNLASELQYENPEEELIAQILAQKDAPAFEPPEGFEDLKALFEHYNHSPLKLYQALEEYRFKKIGEMVGVDVFAFRYVLGYLARLIIAEKWMELDKKKGLEIVDNIIKGSTA